MQGKYSILILIIFSLFLIGIVCAGTNDKIIFLHHSTGELVYIIGNVPSYISNYNTQQGTNYQITDREYPNTPWPWSNYPYDYWKLWINNSCNSNTLGIECMNTLTQNYNMIIYKHCFPGADVLADTGNPDINSQTKSLENYKLQYRALRTMMDNYPNNKFIVWTLAPRREADTNSANAARAREFANWVKNTWLTEDGKAHNNIFIFDYFGLMAGTDNYLKDEYVSGDSHPNNAGCQYAGPIFAQFIIDTAKSSLNPPQNYCGDGICNATTAENCSSCSVDCGSCPCIPYTCPVNYIGRCGSFSDNCQGTLTCSCNSPQQCNTTTNYCYTPSAINVTTIQNILNSFGSFKSGSFSLSDYIKDIKEFILGQK
jgi:hypothetical protein